MPNVQSGGLFFLLAISRSGNCNVHGVSHVLHASVVLYLAVQESPYQGYSLDLPNCGFACLSKLCGSS